MNDVLTSLLTLSGALLVLAAAIGVLRLPDVLCRAHAVAKALTLGIFLMLLGLWVDQGQKQAALKIFLAIFFQVVTIPIGSHLIALLAFEKNIPRWRHRPIEDHRRAGGSNAVPHPGGGTPSSDESDRPAH
ncbi:MAG TPA: monovalent cation/H(+) antiporter subunit G [Verrucomicrobiota bacterium]|nr:monovalent cation/H(+) antiporter subunit G [Verrucomicrobiota bacterium]HRZ35888.1 monovalent cation/H(+) antiporter subunit G [Candidatus Paceibacterota bacterium]HRZ57188.1 monovalent cation/H(+) antiporter subunit G [Candidatus Paceibacterota bacterium]